MTECMKSERRLVRVKRRRHFLDTGIRERERGGRKWRKDDKNRLRDKINRRRGRMLFVAKSKQRFLLTNLSGGAECGLQQVQHLLGGLIPEECRLLEQHSNKHGGADTGCTHEQNDNVAPSLRPWVRWRRQRERES